MPPRSADHSQCGQSLRAIARARDMGPLTAQTQHNPAKLDHLPTSRGQWRGVGPLLRSPPCSARAETSPSLFTTTNHRPHIRRPQTSLDGSSQKNQLQGLLCPTCVCVSVCALSFYAVILGDNYRSVTGVLETITGDHYTSVGVTNNRPDSLTAEKQIIWVTGSPAAERYYAW